MSRRPFVFCCTISLLLFGLTAAPAQATTVRRAVSLNAPTTVAVGATYSLTGRVTHTPRRSRVVLQRRTGGRWKTTKKLRTTTSKGTFTVRLNATTVGRVSYRAYAPRKIAHGRTLRGAASRTRTVTITTPAPTPPTPTPPTPTGPTTVRISSSADGAAGNGSSGKPTISADGRFVAFESDATNLVPGDTNEARDIFVKDRLSGGIVRVSVNSAGEQSNGMSTTPAISADGHHVAFASAATNLDRGDGNGQTDVFVRDLTASETTLVSWDANGEPSNGSSYAPAISREGIAVAFTSEATDLVSHDDNASTDVFLSTDDHLLLVSGNSDGVANSDSARPAISGDGTLVAFDSDASNLVGDDGNGQTDVFVFRAAVPAASAVTRVSTGPLGTEGNGRSTSAALDAAGTSVVFESSATNLAAEDTNTFSDVFVHDLTTSTTRLVSSSASQGAADEGSFGPRISGNGAHVTFSSWAQNLTGSAAGDVFGVFVRDLSTASTARVSVTPTGAGANGGSDRPALSGDGAHVAFESDATDLVSGDTNAVTDVFVRGSLTRR